MSYVVTAILNQHFEKKKRERSAVSIGWLSKRVAVSPSYISQILSGKRQLPNSLIDSLCTALDIDEEKQDVLTHEVLRTQGWSPLPKLSLVKNEIRATPHSLPWSNIPTIDFSLILTHELMCILECTLVQSYDGTPEFVSRILDLPLEQVKISFENLKNAGYLAEVDGVLRNSTSLLEAQSKFKKENIVRFHKDVLDQAKKIMDERQNEEDLAARLITSSVFTCSREHLPLLKAKIAAFIKEISAESASQNPEEVYSLGIAFYPNTKAKTED